MAVPASLSLLQAAYPERRARARAFGAWGGVAGPSPRGAGPVAGGLLSAASGRRAVFFVSVPIGLIGVHRYRPVRARRRRPRPRPGPGRPGHRHRGPGRVTAALDRGRAPGHHLPRGPGHLEAGGVIGGAGLGARVARRATVLRGPARRRRPRRRRVPAPPRARPWPTEGSSQASAGPRLNTICAGPRARAEAAPMAIPYTPRQVSPTCAKGSRRDQQGPRGWHRDRSWRASS